MPNILSMMMGAAGASSGTATIWGWGLNDLGQLGQGNTTSYSSPQQVGALADWSASASRGQIAACNDTSGAIKDDGSLWMWGRAQHGALADGTIVNKSSPVQVGSLTDWASLAVGDNCGAVKSDGTLWMWGSDGDGQLGNGTVAVSKSSPVQIGSLTNWAQVASGKANGFAVKTDGTLWSWGIGTNGVLGDGTTVGKCSPVQIGSLTTWSKVSAGNYFCLAIKTDGTLWAWGKNSLYGNLGVGNQTDYSSPVQVGSLTDWSEVNCGSAFSAAIKTDGTLWMWGNGTSGQLGNGTTTEVNTSPIQVGSLTNWSKLCIGGAGGNPQNSAAIKTDGTLWEWGRNDQGQLGQGDTTNTSSPVQVGSLTTWVDAGVGNKAIIGTISV
jgi:alpha-tubulin suppressor-like RCC1 family protein